MNAGAGETNVRADGGVDALRHFRVAVSTFFVGRCSSMGTDQIFRRLLCLTSNWASSADTAGSRLAQHGW